eukprot:GGOE01008302.1.p3 GENE.GGOE01008302.1~~GGOE01008302.1.p3  ORF type:complete len:117 (-),score=1.77 GGOE01008302.1:658-1008(-)
MIATSQTFLSRMITSGSLLLCGRISKDFAHHRFHCAHQTQTRAARTVMLVAVWCPMRCGGHVESPPLSCRTILFCFLAMRQLWTVMHKYPHLVRHCATSAPSSIARHQPVLVSTAS